MLVLRIDDVGRLSTDDPESGSDRDLEYFSRWRKESGLVGLPVVYGVVPAWISEVGQNWILDNLRGQERIAIHGWDHVRGKQPIRTAMEIARRLFRSDTYIPPFNEYTDQTIKDWAAVGGKFFLGGFHGEHHSRGNLPQIVNGIIHLPAYSVSYGKAIEISNWLYKISNDKTVDLSRYPLVMTLHIPWEKETKEIAALVDKIREYLVTLEKVEQWLLART